MSSSIGDNPDALSPNSSGSATTFLPALHNSKSYPCSPYSSASSIGSYRFKATPGLLPRLVIPHIPDIMAPQTRTAKRKRTDDTEEDSNEVENKKRKIPSTQDKSTQSEATDSVAWELTAIFNEQSEELYQTLTDVKEQTLECKAKLQAIQEENEVLKELVNQYRSILIKNKIPEHEWLVT